MVSRIRHGTSAVVVLMVATAPRAFGQPVGDAEGAGADDAAVANDVADAAIDQEAPPQVAAPPSEAGAEPRFGLGIDVVVMVPLAEMGNATGPMPGASLHAGYSFGRTELFVRASYQVGVRQPEAWSMCGNMTALDRAAAHVGARAFLAAPYAGPYVSGELGVDVLYRYASYQCSGMPAYAGRAPGQPHLGIGLGLGWVWSPTIPIHLGARLTLLESFRVETLESGQTNTAAPLVGVDLLGGYTLRY